MRLNRAIVHLRAGQTAAARADYLELLRDSPHSWKVLYGLAETSWREQDTNNAIRYYQECLPRSRPRSPNHTSPPNG